MTNIVISYQFTVLLSGTAAGLEECMQPFYENHAPLFHCFYFNMDSFPSHLHKEIEIAWVESGRMPVSYTHLDVYKRQVIW